MNLSVERHAICFEAMPDQSEDSLVCCKYILHFALYNISFPSRHAVFSDLGMRCFFFVLFLGTRTHIINASVKLKIDI